MSIKVVSFDLFQTLVDVNQRIPQIWKGILGLGYSEEKAMQGAEAIFQVMPGVFHQAMTAQRFWNMEKTYLECAKQVVEKLQLDITPQVIVHHLLYQHSKAPFYSDVMPCFTYLKGKYQLILSSDSNHMMVDELLSKLAMDQVFISDDLKSYKASNDQKFFKHVIDRLGISPDEMIHIGDSSADVIGADRCGIHTCWLNRDHRIWSHEIRPEFTVTNLKEFQQLL